ncbi:MAG: AMMECR1 domain-containing protein [Armatimonadota bacterium]
MRRTLYILLGMFACLLLESMTAPADDLVRAFKQDPKQGEAALVLARSALEQYCRTREPLSLPKELPPLLRQRSAVFVSAMMSGTGAPRCCMGTLLPREATLAQEIVANANAAAAHDKRFPPIKPEELPRMRIIVSIIGAAQPIANPTILDPVEDGLAVCGPRETGVVLPGETADVQKMIAWGRTRAGVKAGEAVQYQKLTAVRFMEAPQRPPRGKDTP